MAPGSGTLWGVEADLRRREAVREVYSAAARDPGGAHPFVLGRELATGVGYPAEQLDRFPEGAVSLFAGVGATSVEADLRPGQRVLDLGCGGGLDSLIAAERVGPGGQVVAVDFSGDMLERAAGARQAAGAWRVSLCRAAAESLPLADGSLDRVLVNGIFNLSPARSAIFSELARVVPPGGQLYAAELILRAKLPEREQTEASWFA